MFDPIRSITFFWFFKNFWTFSNIFCQTTYCKMWTYSSPSLFSLSFMLIYILQLMFCIFRNFTDTFFCSIFHPPELLTLNAYQYFSDSFRCFNDSRIYEWRDFFDFLNECMICIDPLKWNFNHQIYVFDSSRQSSFLINFQALLLTFYCILTFFFQNIFL